MIVRFGGGNNGIAEYLEKGMKQGRMFSRDELNGVYSLYVGILDFHFPVSFLFLGFPPPDLLDC